MVEHVGRDQNLLGRSGNVPRQPRLSGQVQAGKRFIKQQHLRRCNQQRQPAHLLALALAEAADGALGPVGQSAFGQQLAGFGLGLLLVQTLGAQT